MAEANAAEPNEGAAPQPRRPRRTHVINLCCAQSVEDVVEEVARNLRGLGFRVRVVCGAQARAALLGSRDNSDQPMIHVVCVQGSMQERVLKPLRQALATHGGPNHHLFVAVLDLAVPLAMVGQIRRFAEALERPAAPTQPGPKGQTERRRWREHSPFRDSERIPTRNYPAVTQVVERPGTVPAEGDADRPRRRTKSLTTRGRAARIGPTSKYRAVTASHQAVPPPTTGVLKRRRESSSLRAASTLPGLGERVLSPPAVAGTKPPPPPAPGEMARRRSSTTLPAIDDETATKVRPAEPDRVLAATSAALRFTPPAVKAAEIARTKSGRFVAVPPEGRTDAVSETASTLRLDDPPFPELDDRTTRYGQDDLRQQIESVAAEVDAEAKAETETPSPGDTGTMVAASREDPSASTSGSLMASTDEGELPVRPRKTVLYHESPAPEPESVTAEPTSEAEPTTASKAEPDAKGAVEAKGEPEPDAAPEATSHTQAEDPEGDEAAAVSESAATLLRPSRPGGTTDDDEIAESDKTLLRPDGTFVTTRTLLSKLERTTISEAEPPPADDDLKTISEATRPPIQLDPEDRVDETAKKTTALYADSDAEAGATEARSPDVEARDEDAEPSTSAKATTPAAAAPQRQAKGDARPARTTEPRRTETVAATPPTEERKGGRSWLWVAVLLLLIAGGFGAHQAGLLDGVLGRKDSKPTTIAAKDGSTPDDAETPAASGAPPNADAEDDGTEPATNAEDDGTEPAADTDAGSEGAMVPAAGTEGQGSTGAEPAGGTEGEPGTDDGGTEPAAAEGTGGDDVEPEPNDTADVPEPEPEPGDGPRLTPEEEILAAAADERRVTMLKTLFVSKRQGESTTWIGGNARCSAFELDGVDGWRLPHRREMKLINVVLRLPRGMYWTFTVPKDDRRAAYVLDTDTNGLSLFLKQEPTGEVVCVRRRRYPDED